MENDKTSQKHHYTASNLFLNKSKEKSEYRRSNITYANLNLWVNIKYLYTAH